MSSPATTQVSKKPDQQQSLVCAVGRMPLSRAHPPGRAATALAIARQIGLVGTAGARVIAGDRLQRMSATQL